MSTCATTGLTVPECSCNGCLEDQLRRHGPVRLLETEVEVAAFASPADAAPAQADGKLAA